MSTNTHPKNMNNGKQYIGNGKQKEGSAFIILTLNLDDILQAESIEYKGKRYVKAVVARNMKPAYGNTHQVYVVPSDDRDQQRQNELIDHQEVEALDRD